MENPNPQVIIIGAGASGIAAADFLRENGVDYVVLEARDRIGGRIFTDSSLGFTCDFGASWIHGEKGSPMKKLADKYKIPLIKFDYDSIACIEDGKKVNADKIMDKFEKFESTIEKYTNKTSVNTPLSEMLEKIADDNNYSDHDRKLLELYSLVEIESEYGNKLDVLSGSTFSDSEGNDGDDWLIPGGYIQILEKVAAGMPIKLNTPVKVIDQESKPGKVVVTTTDGQVYESDYLICTLPLGVLKAGVVEFKPPLPKPKEKSIKKLGFGSLDKAVLVFEESFWPDVNCLLVWQSQDMNKAFYAINLQKIVGKPALMVFLPLSKREKLANEDAAVEFVMEILRSAFPEEDINLLKYKVTDWRNETFTRGAYSSLAVGCELQDIKNAMTPDDRIFFAGEHTYSANTSTVCGAFSSGEASAKAILKSL